MRESLDRLFGLLGDLPGQAPSPLASARPAFTLSETIRALHETNRMTNRIEEARTEKLLSAGRA